MAVILGRKGGGSGGGGGAPSGPAGGSLSGTYPNPGIANDAVGADEIDGADAAAIRTLLGVGASAKLYDFTITGSDQAAIDTNVDAGPAGALSGAYSILEIWMLVKTDVNGTTPSFGMTFNNDTAANYDQQVSYGQNATNGAFVNNATTSLLLNAQGSGANGSSYPSVCRVSIPGYASTTFFKAMEETDGGPGIAAAAGITQRSVGGWRSTSAITRIAITAAGATKFKVGSRLIIYGR